MCGETLPLSEFYRHPAMADGHLGKCKTCTKEYVRDYHRSHVDECRAYEKERSRRPERRASVAAAVKERRKNPAVRAAYLEYNRRSRALHPTHYSARVAVGNAVRDGRLLRQPCEVCGATKAEAHHDDYTRPLDVRWLCKKHHYEHHAAVANDNDGRDG